MNSQRTLSDTTLVTDTVWREDASCLDYPAVLFFGLDDSESPAERRTREENAKRVCWTCGVREECLEYALLTKEPYGIWGGPHRDRAASPPPRPHQLVSICSNSLARSSEASDNERSES